MRDPFSIIAAREGISREEVYREVQTALDLAWADPANRPAFYSLTGTLEKPSPEEFIYFAAGQLL